MESAELVDVVTRLVGTGARRFKCSERRHGAGHVCLASSGNSTSST